VEKRVIALGIIAIVLAGAVGLLVYERKTGRFPWEPKVPPGVSIGPPVVTITYENGATEKINTGAIAKGTVNAKGVYWGGSPIVELDCDFPFSATVDSVTGITYDTTQVEWVTGDGTTIASKDTFKEAGKDVGTTYHLHSIVSASEIQSALGEGSFDITFHAKVSASTTYKGESLKGSAKSDYTTEVVVRNYALSVTLGPGHIETGGL